MPLSDAQIRKQAVQDFKDKLILERKLRKDLARFDRSIVRQFRKDVLQTGMSDASQFQGELKVLLNKHYKAVSSKFEGRTLNRLSKNFVLSTAEKESLERAMTNFIDRRSLKQANIILDNTQKNMHSAVRIALEESVDQVNVALNASSILSRTLKSRETRIASLETQAVAEGRKIAEADIFSGKDPLTLQIAVKFLTKEWVTMGDERVRPAHVSADAQLQKADDFFVVMGENLRFPGDTDFGASVGNVINCRCNAIYSV